MGDWSGSCYHHQIIGASDTQLRMSVLNVLRKRQAVFEEDYDEDVLSTTEALLVEEPPTGVSLAQILGMTSLVIFVFYVIGISWKLWKIHRGTYQEETPVFLKYK